MKKSFSGIFLTSFAWSLTMSSLKAEFIVPSGTIIYHDTAPGKTTIPLTSPEGIAGMQFTADYSCDSDATDNNSAGGIIRNQACLNLIIKSSSNNTIEIAPNVENASVEIGSGSNPTTINNQGLSVNGENLIKKSSDGITSIGKNSLKLQELNGSQKMWATDASGKSIPIDITNGSKLLINGRDVEQSINNVGALSAALTGLPTVPTETNLACGLGTGTHGGDLAFSGGCASKVNEKLSINYAASMAIPGQNYAGDFEDTFSARAGFVWKLGTSSKPTQIGLKDKIIIHEKISILEKDNEILKAKNDEIISQNKKLLSRLEKLENVALMFQSSTEIISVDTKD